MTRCLRVAVSGVSACEDSRLQLITTLKSIHGNDVCATGITSLVAFSSLCLSQCAGLCKTTLSSLSCAGFDYYPATNTCSFFNYDQVNYTVVNGCKHYTVNRPYYKASVYLYCCCFLHIFNTCRCQKSP